MEQPVASLIDGGLWHRLMKAARLERSPHLLAPRRAAALAALAWIPLLALSARDGTTQSGVTLPFLHDLAAHVRCLIAIPVLVFGEAVLALRLRPAVDQFRSSGLVDPELEPRFTRAIDGLRRRVAQPWPELALLAFAFALPWVSHAIGIEADASTWRTRVGAGGTELTAAGQWFRLVSVPLSLFLALRWLWWLALWSGFLRRVAALPLRYVPAHPDGHGGVGFIANAQTAWLPFVLATSAVLAAGAAERIFVGGHALPEFYAALGSFVALAVAVPLAPLVVFAPALARLKRAAVLAYGRLASQAGRRFDEKWVAPRNQDAGAAVLETGDTSMICDFGSVFATVQKLSPIPIERSAAIPLAAAAVLPLLPLALTVWPLDVIVKQLVGILL